MKRTKIPDKTEGHLIFKSDFKCCVCKEKGDHIHHLDNNPNNHDIENLALLCFHHHDLATIIGGLSKKLSKEAIIEYRSHHYQVIENKRANEKKALNNHISILSEEKLLAISKNAIIIIELENIKERYFSADWSDRAQILHELDKFTNHVNNRLSYDILEFLSMASSETRYGMTEDVALFILFLVRTFSPSFNNKKEMKGSIELAKQCIQIGECMTYDSFIHLKKLSIALSGLSIIKIIYRAAVRNKIEKLIKEVESTYVNLLKTLQRPERDDLNNSIELLGILKADLQINDLGYPKLPEHLMKIIDKERIS